MLQSENAAPGQGPGQGPDKKQTPIGPVETDANFQKYIDRLDDFTKPDLGPVLAMRDALGQADIWLASGAAAEITKLAADFGKGGGKWSSAAAENFGTYILAPFGTIVQNQRTITIKVLQDALDTYADMLKRRKTDALTIANKTIEVLDSLNIVNAKCLFCASVVALALAGGGLTISGIFIGAAATTAEIGVAISSASVAITSSVISNVSIGGATPSSVLSSMTQALDGVEKEMDAKACGAGNVLQERATKKVDQILQADAKGQGTRIPVLVPREPDTGAPRVTDGNGHAVKPKFTPPTYDNPTDN
ncbi:MAG TPA: hypothetical protein VE172_05205 [Stackebrandtia sp.]|uniref:hypothetical protein n=1 Tax=Stackebrandtia sp. TaxID=2023065 RepID=UPI002D75A46A|nr:hypothetical protein [Stackebrandtia sp.]HZE38192.1 hypothetical protein [Stackebrandtia sp.]